jgi:hypothetical protein
VTAAAAPVSYPRRGVIASRPTGSRFLCRATGRVRSGVAGVAGVGPGEAEADSAVTRSDRRSVFVAALHEARAMLRTGALASPDPLAALSREVACVLVSPYIMNALPGPSVSPKGGSRRSVSGSYFGSSVVRGDEHLDARHIVRGECVCLVPRVGSWPAPRGQRALCRSSPAHGASGGIAPRQPTGASGGIVLHQPTGHRVVAS